MKWTLQVSELGRIQKSCPPRVTLVQQAQGGSMYKSRESPIKADLAVLEHYSIMAPSSKPVFVVVPGVA